MKPKLNINFCADMHGFSTTFDVLLLLILISICAVILLPTFTGNIQVKSALESKSQKHSSEILLTLLDGRVNEFEYVVAGEQMDAIAGRLNINKSSVYETGKKIIAGKELEHKTFADLAAESAATQWVIYHNGTKVQFNFLMTNYTKSLDSELKDYLDRQIGDRYSYNFTVVWRPFVGVPIGSDVRIGDNVPKNAYSETAYITMPYRIEFTRKHVEDVIDNNFKKSRFGSLVLTFDELKKNDANRTAIEEEIVNKINDIINETVDEAADRIVDETLGPVLENAKNTMIEQANDLLSKSEIPLDKEINDRINSALDNAGAGIADTVSERLKSYLKDVTKQEVHEISKDEIKDLVTDLADLYVNNAISISEVKDRILTEVFLRINIGRAQATLSIWEKRK